MSKTITQRTSAQLLLQQKTELERFKNTYTTEAIRAAEDRLLVQCMDIVEGLLNFALLGYDTNGEAIIPPAWQELSAEEKAHKLALARYGALPSADIPHGAKLAHATLIGIIRARAHEKTGTHIFNMEVSTFPAPAPLEKKPDAIDAQYEIIDID